MMYREGPIILCLTNTKAYIPNTILYLVYHIKTVQFCKNPFEKLNSLPGNE